jgi:transposase-like protein
MALQRRYPEELRRRAVRLVLNARDAAGGRRVVCTRVGQQLGVPPDTLRGWVQRAEINEGRGPVRRRMSMPGWSRWSGRCGRCVSFGGQTHW